MYSITATSKFKFATLLIGDAMDGEDLAILVLQKPASLSENVKIAHLPEPDARCPSGKNLIVSGWGRRLVWVGPNAVKAIKNRFLWGVKQECVDIDRCDAYQGDKEAALCVGDLSEPRNFVFFGDSGGIKRI